MPTYTYQCKDCGHTYDAFQSMKADPDTVCPECKGRVDRLIGAGAGIVFKGSGFYVTDYRKDGKSGDPGTSKPAASGDSAKKSEPAASSSSSGGSNSGSSATPSKSSESKGSGKSSDS